MSFEKLLGSELLNGKETVKTSGALEGKYVMLYFSAHWCPPCRATTPVLAEFYNKLKGKRQDVEIVFISSDKDENAFTEYFAEMPWLALPFADRARKAELSKGYKVSGIPTLVVLDKNGNVITLKGRSEFMNDPEGNDFPWVPPILDQLLGNTFITKGGKEITREFKGKVFGIYFSAHWCGPCRRFTPILIKKYEELKAEGKDFEVVFVSSDRDQHGFDEYFGEMPWIAVPFTDKKRIAKLGDQFNVEGIPTLVIIDTDLSTITANGVSAVQSGAEYPFRPKPLNELLPETASDINDVPTLIVFSGKPEDADAIVQTMQPVAEEFVREKKGISFFYTRAHPVVDSIREFAQVPKDGTTVMVLLDIQGQIKAIHKPAAITEQEIRNFVGSYLNKTLQMTNIGQ